MPTPNVTTVGPGTLTIGATTALRNFSSTCVGAKIIPNVQKGDSRTVLSGDVIPGKRTESAQLEAKLVDDFGQTSSGSEFLWANRGKEVPFVYRPSNAGTKQIVGILTVEPIEIAGDVGEAPEHTVTFDLVGMPTFATAA